MTEKKKWLKKWKRLSAGLALAGSLMLSVGLTASVVCADSHVEPGEVFPVSVSMTEPTALGDVYLPDGLYGSVVWVNPGIVPGEGVSYYEVQLIPEDWVDITTLNGYDPDRGGVFQSVEVYVEASEKEGASGLAFIHDSSLTEPGTWDQEGFILNEQQNLTDPDLSDPDGFILNNQQNALVSPDLSDPDGFILNNQQNLADPDMSLPDGFILTDQDGAGPAPDTSLPADFADNLNPATRLVAPDFYDPYAEYGADFYNSGGIATLPHFAGGNLSSKGVTVMGNGIPDYVTLEVSGGSGTYFSTADGADYFASYDLKLWDNENGQEYLLSDGQTAWVSVQVIAGYDYQVEHVKGDGTTEILPSTLNGDILSFSTDSFSSFGVAGSYPISGQATDAPAEDNVAEAAAAPVQDTSASTPAGSGAIAGSSSVNTGTSVSNDASVNNGTVATDTNTQPADTTTAKSAADASSQTKQPVQTGDDTVILPFILLIVAAAILIVLLIMLKRKRR